MVFVDNQRITNDILSRDEKKKELQEIGSLSNILCISRRKQTNKQTFISHVPLIALP